jgi:hypothetical protein
MNYSGISVLKEPVSMCMWNFKIRATTPDSTLHFMSTGKHSEEHDKISANSTQLSQDKHWVTSKATKEPRGPDNIGRNIQHSNTS